MSASGPKGILVKNRKEQFAIIPEEVFTTYMVPEDKGEAFEAIFESDVEGQTMMHIDRAPDSPFELINHEPFNYHIIE